MQKIEVLWRDIAAQVRVKRGRVRGKAMLSHRFQAAIDRAAMRAGKGGSDEYLEDWRRVTTSINRDAKSESNGEHTPQDLAQQFADAIEAAYSNADIAALIASKGIAGKSV